MPTPVPRTPRDPAAIRSFRSAVLSSDPYKQAERQRVAAYRARRQAEARAHPPPDDRPLVCTPDRAAAFVRILLAGVPARAAVVYCAQDQPLSDRAVTDTVRQWAADGLVRAAIAQAQGGPWHDLEPDRRLDVAIDKHLAELAYYLYAHSYETAEGIELAKLQDARKALTEHLIAGKGETAGPWAQMVRDLLAGTLTLTTGPPRLAIGAGPAAAATTDPIDVDVDAAIG